MNGWDEPLFEWSGFHSVDLLMLLVGCFALYWVLFHG